MAGGSAASRRMMFLDSEARNASFFYFHMKDLNIHKSCSVDFYPKIREMKQAQPGTQAQLRGAGERESRPLGEKRRPPRRRELGAHRGVCDHPLRHSLFSSRHDVVLCIATTQEANPTAGGAGGTSGESFWAAQKR